MDKFIANYIGFDGRIGRQSFWLGAIGLAVVSVVISLLILPLLGFSLLPNFAGVIPPAGTEADPAKLTGAINALVADATRKSGWISLIMLVVFAYPSAALCIKRRHDRNNNGIDVWIYYVLAVISLLVQALGFAYTTVDMGNGVIIPVPTTALSVIGAITGIYGIYLLVVLGFLKGTVGSNQYGPDPLGGA